SCPDRDGRGRCLPEPDVSPKGTGTRGPTIARRWLRIEVQFDSEPEWADDVTLKYYVLVGRGREAKLLVGELTHVHVARGTHYSAMFMHPNLLKRLGGQVEAVAVQLFHQNRLVDMQSDPPSRARWWEQYTPLPGHLLSPERTPWAPVAAERYEAIKAAP
ncbi:MAG: hypothetical protein N3A53_08495, partial [Verrucomicrobiae bacterium]|nr:hypothetical protein [Verrucomicrobiae bacterium]